VTSGSAPATRALALLAVVFLGVAGCSGSAATPVPSAVPTPEGTAIAQVDLQAWIRFRLTFGLRADIEWVRTVASDPAASSGVFDVPLLSSEFQQVLDASSAADSLLPIVQRHAQYSPEFAGAWIELPRVALAFTDHLPEHRAEVEALFDDRVVVHGARYTIRELNAYIAELEADGEWFATNGIEHVHPSLAKALNEVRLRLPWPDPATEARIRERFKDTGWMAFTYDGPRRSTCHLRRR
jgi:hypothetical protein